MVGCAAAPGPPRSAGAATGPVSVRVQGNHLVSASGATVRLLGVSRSGTEFMCVKGNAVFDGPSDAASIAAIAGWHTDVVRVPLNEDCWLRINGVNPAWSGAAYQQAVQRYVTGLHQAGLAAVLDLHWSAPGATLATAQLPMADGSPWRSAGMQQLVSAVRGAGGDRGGDARWLRWANDLTGWLGHRPADPAGHDCAHGFIDGFMPWADAHGVSYLGWAWNTDFNCGSGPGLVSDDGGTPTGFGAGLRSHLAGLGGASPFAA